MKKILLFLLILILLGVGLVAIVYFVQRAKPLDLTIQVEPPPVSSIVYNKIYLATSEDAGETLNVSPGMLFDHATQPDLLRLDLPVGEWKSGTLLMYFVDYSTLNEDDPHIVVAASTNQGKTWSEPVEIEMQSNLFFDPIGPSVIQLPDGKIRLFFTGFLRAAGTVAKQKSEKTTYSALSTDGVHFEPEAGTRMKGEQFLNPEIMKDGDEWQLYIGRGSDTILTTSENGSDFEIISKPFNLSGGTPGVTKYQGNTVLFGCYLGLVRAVSEDGDNFFGAKTILEQGNREFCNPSPVVLNDGSMLLAYTVHD